MKNCTPDRNGSRRWQWLVSDAEGQVGLHLRLLSSGGLQDQGEELRGIDAKSPWLQELRQLIKPFLQTPPGGSEDEKIVGEGHRAQSELAAREANVGVCLGHMVLVEHQV